MLEAANGLEALQILDTYRSPLHLLLSDVIMPGMHGPELGRHVKSLRPDIRVLYMSGYPDDVLGPRGVISSDVNFLQKPFMSRTLAGKVREVLARM